MCLIYYLVPRGNLSQAQTAAAEQTSEHHSLFVLNQLKFCVKLHAYEFCKYCKMLQDEVVCVCSILCSEMLI